MHYGVNTDEALILRLVGVPRRAAAPLARVLDIDDDTPLGEIRKTLRESDERPWTEALGDLGPSYRMVWSVVEGTEG